MRVDGYTITKLVHSSDSSRVYEGVSEADRTAVVLKRHIGNDGAEPVSRTLDELQVLRRIASPGVPRAIEVAESADGPVLGLERMPGTPLSQVLHATPMSIDAWLDLGVALAEALGRVHEARILHRDVTPAHVLLDAQSGRAALIGFG